MITGTVSTMSFELPIQDDCSLLADSEIARNVYPGGETAFDKFLEKEVMKLIRAEVEKVLGR